MANEIVPRLLSVVVTPPNPTADMKSLLDALDKIKAAGAKLENDYRSDKLKLVLGLAGEAANNVNPDSFVNRRKQLDEMEAKFNGQLDALNSFSQKFEELIKDYCHSFPTQVEQALRDTLQKLEDARKQKDSEEASINEQVAKIKQLLELCSSTAPSKGEGAKAQLEGASKYKG